MITVTKSGGSVMIESSVLVTLALPAEDSIITDPPDFVTVIISPPTVFSSVDPFGISHDLISLGMTCRRRTLVNPLLFSSRLFKAFDGIFINAEFLGANTVNGPPVARVSTRSAATTAVTNVFNDGFVIAAWTMLGYFVLYQSLPGLYIPSFFNPEDM